MANDYPTPTARTYILVPVEGPVTEFVLEDAGSDFASLQRIVGGYVESVHIPNTRLSALCNEDGRSEGLAMNPRASLIASVALVGDVIITGEPDRDGVAASFLMDDYRAIAKDRGIPASIA